MTTYSVPPNLEKAAQLFCIELQSRCLEIEAILEQATTTNNLSIHQQQTLKKIFHQLKGGAGLLGFTVIENICRRAEDYLVSKVPSTIVAQLKATLVELQSELAELAAR